MAAGPDRQQHRSAHLARPLKPRRALAVTTVLVLLLHALALALLSSLLRPPSLLKTMATPFYTRSIAPEVPAVVAAAPAPMEIKPNRPTALIRPAPGGNLIPNLPGMRVPSALGAADNRPGDRPTWAPPAQAKITRANLRLPTCTT